MRTKTEIALYPTGLSQVAYDMGVAPIFALKSIATSTLGLIQAEMNRCM